MYEYRVVNGWGLGWGRAIIDRIWKGGSARHFDLLLRLNQTRWLGAESGDQDNANFTLLMLLSNTNNITKYKRCSR